MSQRVLIQTFPGSVVSPPAPSRRPAWAWWASAPARRSPAAGCRGRSGCRREIQSRWLSRKAWSPPWGLQRRSVHVDVASRCCSVYPAINYLFPFWWSYVMERKTRAQEAAAGSAANLLFTDRAASVWGCTFSTSGIWGSRPVSWSAEEWRGSVRVPVEFGPARSAAASVGPTWWTYPGWCSRHLWTWPSPTAPRRRRSLRSNQTLH